MPENASVVLEVAPVRNIASEKYKPVVVMNIDGKSVEEKGEIVNAYTGKKFTGYKLSKSTKLTPGLHELKLSLTAYNGTAAKFNTFKKLINFKNNGHYVIYFDVPFPVTKEVTGDAVATITVQEINSKEVVFSDSVTLQHSILRSVVEKPLYIIPIL